MKPWATGAVRAVSKQEVLAAFEGDRAVVWLMLPAEIVDQQIDEVACGFTRWQSIGRWWQF